jgi:hypothetical protein
VGCIYLVGLRWLAVGLGAVIFARLAAWLARIRLGLVLGEGSGLALAIALRLLQLAGQACDLGFELGDTVPQVGDKTVALAAARAGRDVHTSIRGKEGQVSAVGRGRQKGHRRGRGANQIHMFQLPHLLGHRGLADAQRLGPQGHAAGLENGQGVQVHANNLR